MSDPPPRLALEQILDYLRQARGFDFTAYKRTTLTRRMQKRMEAVGIRDYDEYLDYLQVHPDEFPALFNTILINVTRFFRDPDVWEALAETVIPSLLAGKPEHAPLRVWVAGTATGQEAYSIAMLLADTLGMDRFRQRIKIYATDVDEEALAEARQGVYTEKQAADAPDDLRAKFFERAGERLMVVRELRRGVIFGRHDLLQDAPISRVDLLLCRNTLMYLNAEAQSQVMSRFYFSVVPGGCLVLGRAEMLFTQSALFQPIDLKRRIFRTTLTSARHRDRQPALGANGREDAVPQQPDPTVRLRQLAFEAGQDPQIVIDAAGIVVGVNGAARRQFGLGAAEIGTPLHQLELSYRPAELRAHIERAGDERHEVQIRGVAWDRPGGTRYYDVSFAPLVGEEGTLLGTRVSFADVTHIRALQDDLVNSKQELETAYEELQSTNEELETTKEELQSTVEELETTNEELQSTNEELETMNEELQSTNEELQTMNDELRTRGLELNTSNAFLESVLTSLRSAVVVLDRDLRVQAWNARAADLWGLRADEVTGDYFFGLDIGLPVQSLNGAVGEVLHGRAKDTTVVLPATSRKGRPLQCRVTISALADSNRETAGVILVMDEEGAG
ncbi:MAG TPA: CheR family methyltransferase [Vicinamibacterales bacterium]|nr:CheR family methyltransferase [Vicinamibacterales bacterium]